MYGKIKIMEKKNRVDWGVSCQNKECELYGKSTRVVRVGEVPTKHMGKRQRYQCRECGATFYKDGAK